MAAGRRGDPGASVRHRQQVHESVSETAVQDRANHPRALAKTAETHLAVAGYSIPFERWGGLFMQLQECFPRTTAKGLRYAQAALLPALLPTKVPLRPRRAPDTREGGEGARAGLALVTP